MRDKINRAAHHTEEILGFLRKLINILNQEKIQWKTDRSVMILRELCEAVDSFKNEFIIYTEYDKTPYKGGKMYVDVVDGLIKDIREKIEGSTIKYRDGTLVTATKRRISGISTKGRSFGISQKKLKHR